MSDVKHVHVAEHVITKVDDEDGLSFQLLLACDDVVFAQQAFHVGAGNDVTQAWLKGAMDTHMLTETLEEKSEAFVLGAAAGSGVNQLLTSGGAGGITTYSNAVSGTSTVSQYSYELAEAQAELARHHADFEKISDIVEKALTPGWTPRDYYVALKEIRDIVG